MLLYPVDVEHIGLAACPDRENLLFYGIGHKMVSFLLPAYHSSLCCPIKASMKCKNVMDLRLFLWFLHRPDCGLPQNLRIEARAPVAGEDGAEILG